MRCVKKVLAFFANLQPINGCSIDFAYEGLNTNSQIVDFLGFKLFPVTVVALKTRKKF